MDPKDWIDYSRYGCDPYDWNKASITYSGTTLFADLHSVEERAGIQRQSAVFEFPSVIQNLPCKAMVA